MNTCPKCGEKRCEGEPICGLRYIANSPTRERGGFAPEAIATAKSALRLIYKLRRRCAHQDSWFADASLRTIEAEEKLRELGAA